MLQIKGEVVLESMLLFGIFFVVKDNIDVVEMFIIGVCFEFGCLVSESVIVVQCLQVVGVLLVGKINLDQFVIGLVGVCFFYGVVCNVIKLDYVFGGFSLGLVVVVVLGQVMFLLGIDMVGFGCVLVVFNYLVGLKLIKGFISVCGLVLVCCILDCIFIFVYDVVDVWCVLYSVFGFDVEDGYLCCFIMLGVKCWGYCIVIFE